MSKHQMLRLTDEEGNYITAKTTQEARACMNAISPERTKRLLKSYLQSIYLLGLSGVGLCGIIIYFYDRITGHKTDSLVGLLLFPVCFGLFAIIALTKSRAAKKKNRAILSGDYFIGKSDDEIIAEANRDYTHWMNTMNELDKRAELIRRRKR